MAENLSPDNHLPTPEVVDVLPVESVEPLVARYESELRSLRLELENSLQEAEAAERRLHQHPAGALFDDDFEAGVLAHLARSVSSVTAGPSDPAADTVIAALRLPRQTAPSAAASHPSAVVEPVPQPTDPPPPPPASGRPRTVVVDRSRPRTVVVNRGAPPADGLLPPPPPPPPSAFGAVKDGDSRTDNGSPVDVGDGVAAVEPDGRVTSRRARRQAGKKKLPGLLLIQAGVVIVIVALVLLKLG